ncbi:hypothetical protein MED134_16708 [Dokdonia sp. MED134]|uniref:hypothetical protein n=1 Tax=Dokdonia sp. MED134 TaxID=313590 RepID=UPI000068D036|nr:hypothetical protein [Dokdonia sp. MED134]AIN49943.1 hypothetical protein MED134_16708 [Dokdonia sp. MED134]
MKTIELNTDFIKTRVKQKKILSATEEITLKIIYNFQINNKVFFGLDNWLAEKRGLSEKSIQNHLRSLERKGFIDRSKMYRKSRRIICLKPTEEFFHYFQKKSSGTSGRIFPEVPKEYFGHNPKENSKNNSQSNSGSEQVDRINSRYHLSII